MRFREVTDPRVIEEALLLYPYEPIELDVRKWMEETPMLVLSSDDGSIGIFEAWTDNVYTGHYFFQKTTRGKAAYALAIAMLAEAFSRPEIKAVRGLTPEKHKAAVMMTRRLGFKEIDVVDTHIGPCHLFLMTRDEFKERNT